jgi:ATP-dependent DNA helicase RecQ
VNPEQVLKKYWGYDTFRLTQKAVIESILLKQDTLALLPTGGGKSVCYQVPGLIFDGVTIVISPLISLMKDQVDGLKKRDISATYLASTLSDQELQLRITACKNNDYRFIYVSPEKLKSKQFADIVQSLDITLVVVDESHCVSLWGSDFRPSYLEIPVFISKLSRRPVVAALTATATPATQQEIVSGLKLLHPSIFKSSFKRNIACTIIKTGTISEHELQLFAYLRSNNQTGIIYTSSRSETERLTHKLNHVSHLLHIDKVGCYHAGLSATERQQTQQLFLENKLQILVATTAFGMGIDKPDINFVIHFHPPATLEGYYQEIGRAGRSGQFSSAIFLFNPQHLTIQYGLLAKNKLQKPIHMFEDVQRFIAGTGCRMQSILKYFGEESSVCGICDSCIKQPTRLNKWVKENTSYTAKLGNWRESVAKKYGIPTQTVLTSTQAAYLLLLQPKTRSDLALVPGIGYGWLNKWSESYLSQEWYNTDTSSI